MTTIDVHSHIFPQIYLDALKAANAQNVDGYPPPEWSLEDHLKVMDSHEIQACMLSLSSPGLAFATPDVAANLSRAINIQFAEIVGDRPSRFGAFALLPLPDVAASLKEIEYALDVLKLDGIGLYTNYKGVYLGNWKFAPVLDELHKRGSVVFVHPTTPPHSDELTLGYPAPMLEYPFDTTRMVLSLLDTDTLKRCNHIKFIFCHGGGALPLLSPRIGPLMQMRQGGQHFSAPADAMRAERQIAAAFFDLTAATHPAFLAALKASHEPAKLLAGFDYPFMPAISINRAKEGLSKYEGFSDREKRAIDQINAEQLFPRLAEAILPAS